MRIYFFINSLTGGGAERNVINLANYMANENEVCIYLMENIVQYPINEKVNIISFNFSNKRNALIKFLQIPFVSLKLYSVVKRDNPDYLISFLNRANYSAALLKLFGIKTRVVISERISPKECYDKGISGAINRLLIKTIYPLADLIIPNSYHTANQLENYFGIKSKMIVVHNSLDTGNVIAESVIEPLAHVDDSFTILFLGRIEKQKALHVLLQALAFLKDKPIELLVAGTGSMLDEMEKFACKLGIVNKVKFLGFQSNPFALMTSSDCIVLSSLYEGFPNVLIESLALGLPVISTDCNSGPRELLAPSTPFDKRLTGSIDIAEYGILCPVNDAKALAESINIMMSDKNLRESFKIKGPFRAKDFTLHIQSEKFIGAIRSV